MAVKNQNTGRKDRRITIETHLAVQVEGGGTQDSISSTYTMWADVENKDGRLITSENQREWTYNYKVVVRYEKSRQIDSTQTILYGNIRMVINSITLNREGMREEVILKCSAIGNI